MKPIPSIAEIYSNLEKDLKAKLNLSDADLKFVVDATSGVLAAQFKTLYLFLYDVQQNIFPDTADLDIYGGTLNRQGQIYLGRQPFPATSGIYIAAVTGVTGTVLRENLTFKSNDASLNPGRLYNLDSQYTLIGSGDTIQLRALEAGATSALEESDQLTVTEPVIGLDNIATVTFVSLNPTAAESVEVYRDKILDAIILESQGGALADYMLWADDAAGVRRVYPRVKSGDAGTVQVFVEATTADSIDGNGTPSGALLNDVEDVINMDPDTTVPVLQRGRRPAQAILEVLPIDPQPVDIEIIDISTNSAAIQAAIRSALTDFLYNVRPFIAGADLVRDKNDVLTTVRAQSVVTDIIGTSNTFLDFRLYVDGNLVNTYTFSSGNIPYLRNVTYI